MWAPQDSHEQDQYEITAEIWLLNGFNAAGNQFEGKNDFNKKKKKGNEVREFENEIYKVISHTVHPCATPSLECQAML